MALLINLYGAPCSGKTVKRADVFSALKRRGVDVEEVPEVAKVLYHSDRLLEMACQPYILGEQLRQIEVLAAKAEVLVTDAPMLASVFYVRENRPASYPTSFQTFAAEEARLLGGLNFLVTRVGPYDPRGRLQTEEEASAMADRYRDLLDEFDFRYTEVSGDDAGTEIVVREVLAALEGRT